MDIANARIVLFGQELSRTKNIIAGFGFATATSLLGVLLKEEWGGRLDNDDDDARGRRVIRDLDDDDEDDRVVTGDS